MPNVRRYSTLCVLAGLVLVACPQPTVPPRPPPVGRRPLAPSRFIPPEAYRQFILYELASGRGDAKRALAHLRKALAEDPDSPYLRLRIAELLQARGETRLALAQVRAAERVAPAFAESYFLHGRLLFSSRPRAALGLLERAIRLDPTDERPYLWLARVRLRLGDTRGEQAALGRLLKRQPQNVEALYGLAKARARLGDRVGAVGLLHRITVVRPFAVQPRLLLARQRLLQGKTQAAIGALLDGLEASADDPVVAQELFRLYRSRQRNRLARDLVKLMAVHASARYLVFVASLYDSMNDEARASKAVDRALRQDPQYGPGVALKARLLLRSHGFRAAAVLLERVDAKSRAFVASRIALAEIIEGEGRRAEAIRVLRKASAARPRSAELPETLALVYARGRRTTEALRALAAAGRLKNRSPSEVEQRYLKALVLEEAGQLGAAKRIAEALIRDDPDDAQALNLLGYSLAVRGIGLKRAVALLKRARRLDPLSPYILDSLGWARYRQGRYRVAVGLLEQAARADGRLHDPWDHLGDALAALGRRAAAIRAYRRALGRRPPAYRRAVISGKIIRLSARGQPRPKP